MGPAYTEHAGSHGKFPHPLEHLHSYIYGYIESKYFECYEASILCSYKHLLAVADTTGEIKAAVGYRTPDEGFFLEQYLDSNAEDVLSDHYGVPIPRKAVIEIGNLVGDNSHAVFFLMQALWAHLHQRHYEHVMITCTRKLQRRFRNLPLISLADALCENVENSKDWGSYYKQNPRVMTGRLSSYDQRFSHGKRGMHFTVHFLTSAREGQ